MNCCGTDIVEIARFKKLLGRCREQRPDRLFTVKEWEQCQNKVKVAQSLAARFAGKEAVMKLFRRGGNLHGLYFREIEIINDHYGAPYIVMNKKIRRLMMYYKLINIDVSLAHCRDYAHAVAIGTIITESSS